MNKSTYSHKSIVAKATDMALVTGLLLVLALMTVAMPTARAGYADGTGAGLYQDQIFWLDWQGFTFANGATRTFDLPGGVTVTAVVSNLSGGAIRVSRPEDYSPAAMNHLYPNTGQTALNSCEACTNRFRLSFSANVGGASVPIDLVATDAEAAAPNEYLKLTTDGHAWQLLEQYQAENLKATFSNSDKTLELAGNGATTYGTVLAISSDVTDFDFELKGGGVSAAALGVFLPFDYGDAPSSYADAGHYMRQLFTGGDPGSTKVYDPVSTAFTQFATISDIADLFLGANKPDPDPGTQNNAPNATNAQGDDNDGHDDEEGVASFPDLYSGLSSYPVDVVVHNGGATSATLYGWIDFDNNGGFEASEKRTMVIPAGTNSTETLAWDNPVVNATPGSPIYARFRITTNTLANAHSTAMDGEVEDYAIYPIYPTGKIIVDKVTQPSGDPQSFTFVLSGSVIATQNFSLTDAATPYDSGFLNSGTYNVAETAPAGWDLSSATCDNGSVPSAVNVGIETVTCTFTNTKRANLTVIKNTVGGDGSFDFISTALGDFAIATSGNTGNKVYTNLALGIYDLAETVPAGWDLTGSICSNGKTLPNVELAAGDNVTCTFTNTKRANLTVIKNTVGGDGSFNFISTALGDFAITTSGNTGNKVYTNLALGIYDLAETVPAGWDLTGSICSNGKTLPNVELAAGDDVTCTFTNTKRANLTVIKNTVGGDGSFDFISKALGDFAIATSGNTGNKVYTNLALGIYDLAETVPAGWDLTGSICSNGKTLPNVELAAGDDVTCTFTNTKRANLTVIKNTVGGDGSFNFISTALGDFAITTSGNTGNKVYTNLALGIYDLAETVPAGWDLTGSICSNGKTLPNVELAAGDDVTCTFTNTKRANLTVIKNTVGGDGSFDFISKALGDFAIATSGNTGNKVYTNLALGIYDLAETVPAGWDLTGSICSNGKTLPNVELAAGDDVTCTFTNTSITYTVGGNVIGLSGSGLTLQNNAGDDLPIAADGSFTFATPIPNSSAYNVTVLTQPTNSNQTCSVTNGTGTLAGANVTNVSVDCVTDPVPPPSAISIPTLSVWGLGILAGLLGIIGLRRSMK